MASHMTFVIVNNNSPGTMFLLLQHLNSKFVFQWNFTRLHVYDAQQLAFKIYQPKTKNLSTTYWRVYKFQFIVCTSQWRRFSAAVPRFIDISTGMRILMLEICWCHFHIILFCIAMQQYNTIQYNIIKHSKKDKLALKLQTKTYF